MCQYYQPTCKDWLKLIALPILYMSFMAIAIVFAFYTIDGLLHSYNNPVQSASYRTTSRYPALGIVIIPDFSNFIGCGYRYYDDYSPKQENDSCKYFNVSFNSILTNYSVRNAMVFKGPTDIQRRQSLGVHYLINTTMRQFNAIEYFVFFYWTDVVNKTVAEQNQLLAMHEDANALFTFPAGFTTWIKISYVETELHGNDKNRIEFNMDVNLAKYRDYDTTDDELENCTVYFEWLSPQHMYIKEILSTNFWNSFGSMCGVFITLVRAGEYCKTWIWRIRRERKKRRLYRLEYEQRQKESQKLLN